MLVTRKLAITFLLGICLTTLGVAQAAEKTLRIAYTTAKGGLGDQQMLIFKKLVDKKLPGFFDIKLYPGSQLGSGSENVQAVETGTLEASALGSEGVQVDRRLGLFDLPWIFQGFGDFERVTSPSSELFKDISAVFNEHGLQLLAIYGSGFRDVLTRTPVKSLDAFKGMKIRISVSPARKKFWESLGALPVAIEWADTYLALQQGTVDGVEAFPVFLRSGKMYEQAKYLDNIHYIAAPFFFVVSDAYWKTLPDKAKNALTEAGKESVREANHLAVSREKDDIKFMEQHGVHFVRTDLKGYQKIRSELTKQYREQFGEKWLQAAGAL